MLEEEGLLLNVEDDGKYVEDGLFDGKFEELGGFKDDGLLKEGGDDGVKDEEEKEDDLYTKGPPLSP